jgi:hypothetical protein
MKTNGNNQASRRSVLRAGLSMVAAAGAAGAAMAGGTALARGGAGELQLAQAAKLAQNVVQYQETPKDGAMCSLCVNFIAPNACKIVAGTINPNGWCVAYAPKSG